MEKNAMTLSTITHPPKQEANMGKTRTIIAALAAERGISRRQFEGLCYAEDLSLDTARKIWNGDASVQDVQRGAGMCLVDPHGDLIEDVLCYIPKERAKDVVLFDPSDTERPDRKSTRLN